MKQYFSILDLDCQVFFVFSECKMPKHFYSILGVIHRSQFFAWNCIPTYFMVKWIAINEYWKRQRGEIVRTTSRATTDWLSKSSPPYSRSAQQVQPTWTAGWQTPTSAGWLGVPTASSLCKSSTTYHICKIYWFRKNPAQKNLCYSRQVESAYPAQKNLAVLSMLGVMTGNQFPQKIRWFEGNLLIFSR